VKGWYPWRWIIDVVIWALLVGADRLTKNAALAQLQPGVPQPVGSWAGIEFSWTLTYNEGAAWGVFDGFPIGLLLFRCFFIALLLFVYWSSRASPLSRTAIAVILAGATGNIVDSFVHGHVIDMIHINFWGWHYPVFNLADAEICIGVVVLILMGLLPSKSAE
jgi:signal peptidase II